MKSVFTLFLILILTSILVTSCSQLSNTALTKSYNQSAFYVEPDGIKQCEPTKEEINIFPETGNSPVQTDLGDLPETGLNNNLQVSDQLTSVSNINSFIKEDNIIPVFSYDTIYLTSNFRQSNEIIDEFKEMPTTDQAVNYANNSNGASHGVPFFLIFLCAFFIPPLGVAMMFGITDKFWICLGLTLLFWLPGMIYAMIQIFN